MKKKIDQSTLKLLLVCTSIFAVCGLLFMLKRKTKKMTQNTKKNGIYSNKNSLAALNHNPTNIVKTASKWTGEIETPQILILSNRPERFKAFESDYYGILAAYNNLKSYFNRGYNTVRKIITRWAPPSENDTGAYIATIAKRVGVGVDEALSIDKHAFRLLKEIARVESGFTGDDIILSVVNLQL